MNTNAPSENFPVVDAAKLDGNQESAMIMVSDCFKRALTQTYCNGESQLVALYELSKHHPRLAIVTKSLKQLSDGDMQLSNKVAKLDRNILINRLLMESLDRIDGLSFQVAIAEFEGLRGWLLTKTDIDLKNLAALIQSILDGYAGLAAVDHITEEF